MRDLSSHTWTPPSKPKPIRPTQVLAEERRMLALAKRRWMRATGRKRGFPQKDIQCHGVVGKSGLRVYCTFSFKDGSYKTIKSLLARMLD